LYRGTTKGRGKGGREKTQHQKKQDYKEESQADIAGTLSTRALRRTRENSVMNFLLG
jgi:hypothetical protein